MIDHSEEITSLQEGIKWSDKQIFDLKQKIEKIIGNFKDKATEPSPITVSEV